MSTRRLGIGFLAATLTLGASAADDDLKVIFDGASPKGWIINYGSKPLPAANVQQDGLNPHNSGGYVVVYETPVKDFVLDFDYKLSKGCNSGVFLRVGDLQDPVNSGLEVAIDDTVGTGMHDPGAIYDLVSPKVNAQKPAGEWNHMTITAKGPKVTVVLNGKEVSQIDQSQFTEPGKRPDGSSHKFSKVKIKDLEQKGYFGFQDHGQDCWYKNVKLNTLD
jgi:hypothetical protein